MKKLIIAIAATLFAASSYAQAPKASTGDCEAKAVSKSGKPLAGAAKNAFVKKCRREGAGPGPMAKPMPGVKPMPVPMPKPEMKPMPKPGSTAGPTAQQNRMKECAGQGKGKKGDDYKMFMKKCLSGK